METNTPGSVSFIPKSLWLALGGLLVAFLALTVIDKVHTIQQDFKNTLPQNTISMSAEGKATSVPDLATVTLGVLTNAATAKDAQADNTKKVNALIDFVKKQGVDSQDIVTTQLNVYPQYNYQNGTNNITGYSADQTITLKVHGVDKSTDKLDAIVGGATDAGANQIQGVSLSFENPDDLKQQARKQAIDKAKAQAKELADQAGLKLGKVVSISENSSSTPYPIPYAADLGGKGGGGPANIQTGTQDVIESITLTFELK
ncbi:MAG TPA: SIMPL domain-containing protein [Methylomirabilota bacterium]|nr:SIMPL domain-containing protein [Methylomirabilota bacterium]